MNRKPSIVIKRIKAFGIDYLIIAIYIVFLFGTTLLVSNLFDIPLENVDTVKAELMGFFTLTLPVILYFTFSEAGRYAGSFGKRKFGLKVVLEKLGPAGFPQLLLRNCVKFLPWEVAHFFIFQLFYFVRTNTEPPAWVLGGLVGSQVIAVIYLLFMLFNKNNRSLYEMASSTRVISNTILKTV